MTSLYHLANTHVVSQDDPSLGRLIPDFCQYYNRCGRPMRAYSRSSFP